jgi:hypothetical protein
MWKVLSLTIMVMSMSSPGPQSALPPNDGGYLSLILSHTSAERDNGLVTFRCSVELENATGKEIKVISNFGAELDGIDLVVTNEKGQILVQQTYTYHQSPIYAGGKTVVIKKGKSSLSILFPIRGLDPEIKAARVRLVGRLSKSTYKHICSSETIAVVVRDIASLRRD